MRTSPTRNSTFTPSQRNISQILSTDDHGRVLKYQIIFQCPNCIWLWVLNIYPDKYPDQINIKAERPFSFINNVCDNYFPHGSPSLIPWEYTKEPLCHVKYRFDSLTFQMSEMSTLEYFESFFSFVKLPVNPWRNFLQKTKENISIELNCFHPRAGIFKYIFFFTI